MLNKNSWAKKFFEFHLNSNPRIPEYQDLAFCLRVPTQFFPSEDSYR
jgi:hypothetical protein